MFKNSVLLFSTFLLFGCMSATSQSDIDYLKKEVSKLQIKYSALEAKQAQMYSKFEENLVNAKSGKVNKTRVTIHKNTLFQLP